MRKLIDKFRSKLPIYIIKMSESNQSTDFLNIFSSHYAALKMDNYVIYDAPENFDTIQKHLTLLLRIIDECRRSHQSFKGPHHKLFLNLGERNDYALIIQSNIDITPCVFWTHLPEDIIDMLLSDNLEAGIVFLQHKCNTIYRAPYLTWYAREKASRPIALKSQKRWDCADFGAYLVNVANILTIEGEIKEYLNTYGSNTKRQLLNTNYGTLNQTVQTAGPIEDT